MSCLNEPIARAANREDGCSGRFWEGRFRSQALLDEKTLAACLAYVDLNPLRAGMPKGLPFRLTDYLQLLDWTGRAILPNKRGVIGNDQPPVLERLQIDPGHWLFMAQHFESQFKGLVGTVYTLKAACRQLGYRRTPNLGACRRLLMLR